MDGSEPRRHRRVEDLSWEDGEALGAEQQALWGDRDLVAAWGEKNPEVFAGLWLVNDDWLAGIGPVRLGVGVAVEDVAVQLRALVGQPERLVIVPKRLPYRVLRDLQHAIVSAYMAAPAALGQPDVTGVGVDVQANVVRVMLRSPDTEAEEALRQEFGSDRVCFEYGHPSNRSAVRRIGASSDRTEGAVLLRGARQRRRHHAWNAHEPSHVRAAEGVRHAATSWERPARRLDARWLRTCGGRGRALGESAAQPLRHD